MEWLSLFKRNNVSRERIYKFHTTWILSYLSMITDVSHLKTAHHLINISSFIAKNISTEHFTTIQSRFLYGRCTRQRPVVKDSVIPETIYIDEPHTHTRTSPCLHWSIPEWRLLWLIRFRNNFSVEISKKISFTCISQFNILKILSLFVFLNILSYDIYILPLFSFNFSIVNWFTYLSWLCSLVLRKDLLLLFLKYM